MNHPSSDRLFASVYLDEDVSVLIATLLRARGFNALTTIEANRTGSTDEQQLRLAVERDMAILTHNRVDFEKLARTYAEHGKRHCGMLIAVRRAPYELAQRVLRVLNRHSAEAMIDQVLYI